MKNYQLSIFMVVLLVTASANSLSAEIISHSSKNRVEGSYIVKLTEESIDSFMPDKRLKDYTQSERSKAINSRSVEISSMYGGEVNHQYDSILKGFSIKLTEQQAELLVEDPRVEYIEEDTLVYTSETQLSPSWNLDRIDQRNNELDDSYTYESDGTDVNAYVIDTGINTSHEEFEGRAETVQDYIEDDDEDCNGHGTHVAGIIGGATWGVAKDVSLKSIRVLGCDGSGATSDVIAAINWVISNGEQPAVINLSLGSEQSDSFDSAVEEAIENGFTTIVAAGNNSDDACYYSPASAEDAITVGAINSDDEKADYSNYGECIDVFAPGSNVISAYGTSSGWTTKSGTSMAAPHVAGVAALYLEGHTSATTASVIRNLMYSVSYGKVTGLEDSETPNLLVYSHEKTNGRLPFFRYWSASNSDHFYTTNWNELGSAASSSWTFEGVMGYISSNSDEGSALYRYFNSNLLDHFYTTNWSELEEGSENWDLEGIPGYMPSSGSETTPLYRYYSSTDSDHFYTINWGELEDGSDSSYSYEGIPGYVYIDPE